MKAVNTSTGHVQGTIEKQCNVWRGIPYARSPVGGLRFRHAQPHKGWQGVLQATEFGSICPQSGRRRRKNMDEDCLTLNIWSPAGGSAGKAVLFYIHGGSFVSGAGSLPMYNGKKLAQSRDVVVVTVNYRLGALGFLDFSWLDKDFQPNCGLSDLVLALRWVHQNIAAFGGDPGNITIIGQSAGAIAVSALVTMPAAKPYISKAIMMSGSPIWMHAQQDAKAIAQDFLQFMGIESAEQLRQIPAGDLTARQKKFMAKSKYGEAAFCPSVDGNLLAGYPLPSVGEGAAACIPMLIGTTKDELSFACKKLLSKIMMVKDMVVAVAAMETSEIRQNILTAYKKYGVRAKSMIVSDYVFRMSSMWFAQAANRHADTWMYSFDYETLAMRITTLHACHSSDIPFLFGNFGAGRSAFMFVLSPIRTFIRRISNEIQQDFTNFAKTGQLEWKRCVGNDAPAKCYDKGFKIAPMVEPEVAAQFEQSEFKRSCMQGEKAAEQPMLQSLYK